MSDLHFQTFLLAACEAGGCEIREEAGAAEGSWSKEMAVEGGQHEGDGLEDNGSGWMRGFRESVQAGP